MVHDPVMPDEAGRPYRVLPVHIVTSSDEDDPITVLTAAINALGTKIEAMSSENKASNDTMKADLAGIRARLNAGIRVQTVTSLPAL